jgi:hypothetical protein
MANIYAPAASSLNSAASGANHRGSLAPMRRSLLCARRKANAVSKVSPSGDSEIKQCLATLQKTHAGTGFMNEAFHKQVHACVVCVGKHHFRQVGAEDVPRTPANFRVTVEPENLKLQTTIFETCFAS